MDVSFIAHLLNGLLMVAMPVGLAFFLTWKFNTYWRLWWIGAGTFILSQVGHIPFLWFTSNILNQTSMVLWPPLSLMIFNAVFGGLSAGLFEELFRYGMFRWWAKDARSWRTAVLAGAGHGGAEAIALGALAINSFINLAVLRNADLSKYYSSDQLLLAQQQIHAYWASPWYTSMLGALERAFTIPTQIALSVIVIQTFIRKEWFWVWLAVLYHALTDALGAAVAPYYLNNPFLIEAVIGLFAVTSIIIIFVLRRPEPVPAPRTASPNPVPGPRLAPVEETKENLDGTRYQK